MSIVQKWQDQIRNVACSIGIPNFYSDLQTQDRSLQFMEYLEFFKLWDTFILSLHCRRSRKGLKFQVKQQVSYQFSMHASVTCIDKLKLITLQD